MRAKFSIYSEQLRTEGYTHDDEIPPMKKAKLRLYYAEYILDKGFWITAHSAIKSAHKEMNAHIMKTHCL